MLQQINKIYVITSNNVILTMIVFLNLHILFCIIILVFKVSRWQKIAAHRLRTTGLLDESLDNEADRKLFYIQIHREEAATKH
jgi:hypothetical protein